MAWLATVKLSLSQWALITAGAIIAGLVAALRLQGSALHKAQIDAISAQINLTDATEEAKIKVLQDRMAKEIQLYEQAH